MNVINQSGVKFEKLKPFDTLNLIFIRDPKHKLLIGYVQIVPSHGWVWYSNDIISEAFNSVDDAIDNLIRSYIVKTMDLKSAKAGILYIEDYTKGR